MRDIKLNDDIKITESIDHEFNSNASKLSDQYDENPPLREQIKTSTKEIIYKNDIRSIGMAKLESLKEICNIILFTATEIERDTVLSFLKPLNGEEAILKGYYNSLTFFVGCLELYSVVLIMTNQPGSVQRDAIMLDSYEAFKFWKPKIAISCGIAYGLRKDEQKLCDVLISEKIILQEIIKLGESKEFRGSIPDASQILINRFKNKTDWQYDLGNGNVSEIKSGIIITGEKLINDKEKINTLKSTYPQAIGGEMEAAGLYASASRFGIDWITIKGICDWGYDKNDKYQKKASEAAVLLIKSVFKDPYVFDNLDVNPNCE